MQTKTQIQAWKISTFTLKGTLITTRFPEREMTKAQAERYAMLCRTADRAGSWTVTPV